MQDFFTSIWWLIISSVLTVLGAMGTILGIYQHFKSKKDLKEYKYLFKLAGQNIDLEDKENTIQDYNKQITEMRETLQDQIPKEAKKIALQGILKNEIKALTETFSKVKHIQEQIREINSDESENDELLDEVKKVIEPTYSYNRSNALFNSLFFIISILSTFFSIILPYTLYRLAFIGIISFQLFFGIVLLKNYVKNNYSKQEIKHAIQKIKLLTSLIFLIAFAFLVVVFFDCLLSDIYFRDTELVSLIITFIALFVIHFIFGFMYLSKDKRKRWHWIESAIVSFLATTTSFFAIFYFQSFYIFIISLVIAMISNIIDFIILIFFNKHKKSPIKKWLLSHFKSL